MAPVYFFNQSRGSYGLFSQWADTPFHTGDKSIVYVTAEQYMMQQKALLFDDQATAAAIMKTTSPKEQKQLGRLVENFNNEEWEKHRERVVEEGSYHKFVHSLVEWDIKAKLLETGDRELVEASPFDKIWGVGYDEKHASQYRHKWGLNLLGKALMKARERIRKEEEEKGAKDESI